MLFVALLAAALLAFTGAAYLFLRSLPQSPAAPPASVIDLAEDDPTVEAPPGVVATRMPQATTLPVASLPGRQVNILLMGIDQRPGQPVATRTDTMLLISINQESGQIGMISIPRDLWVTVPGVRNDRINTAHLYGENTRSGNGPALAKTTVSNFFGMPVQYYVRMNFQAFRTLIDAVGGIDVDVPKPIDDFNYPDDNCPDPDHCGYDPFHIKAGLQHLDGTTALKYARTRYTDSDFYRARRQQQVILAMRDKVLSARMIPTLLLQAPTLLDQLKTSLSTDLTLPQIAGLAQMVISGKLDTEHVHQLVIDESMTSNAVTPEGGAILMPNMPAIQAALRDFQAKLAIPPTPVPPTANPSLQNLVRSEGARIEVLNGSDRPGLARSTADWLESAGFIIVNVADAQRTNYANTQIINTGDKPGTAQALRTTLKLPANSVSTAPRRSSNGAPDITLILGRDFNLPR